MIVVLVVGTCSTLVLARAVMQVLCVLLVGTAVRVMVLCAMTDVASNIERPIGESMVEYEVSLKGLRWIGGVKDI